MGVVAVADGLTPALASVVPSPPPPKSSPVVSALLVVPPSSTGELATGETLPAATVAGAGAGAGAGDGAGCAAGRGVGTGVDVCTTTRRLSADSSVYGTWSRRLLAWMTTAVANADAAAIIAICGQVRRTERSRAIMAAR